MADQNDSDGEDDPRPGELPSLAEGYREGMTILALAERHGMTYAGVRDALIRSGVTFRASGTPIPVTPEGVVKAYEQGATIRAVATAFGLSFGTARRMLLREGVRLRITGKRPGRAD